MSQDPHESEPGLYDAELPFLRALELDVRQSAERAARVRHKVRPSREPIRVRRGLGRPLPTARVARRALTLVALLCLIGASAFGAREAFSGAGSNPTTVSKGALVPVARGSAGSDNWVLRAYRLGGELCRVLVVAGNEASLCAPPPAPGGVAVTNLVSPLWRYVFGVTGEQVMQVAVHAGGAARTVSTIALDPAVARDAGLPARARYFVLALMRPSGRPDPPALARGVNAAHRPTGPVYAVCVQGTEPRQCPPEADG
jgi:hypothetical protein